ncbi:MAG: beta-propeller domain-containing protein [Acutalibacteraceae bacterium]
MDKNNNFEYELKKEFNKETPAFPDKLQKENLIPMIEEKGIKPEKTVRITWKKVTAIAAVLAVIITSAYFLPVFKNSIKLVDATVPQKNAAQTPESYKPLENQLPYKNLRQPANDSELVDYFVNRYKQNMLDDIIDGVFSYGSSKDTAEGIILESNVAAQNSNGSVDGSFEEYAYATDDMAETVPVTGTAPTAPTDGTAPHGETNTQVQDVDEADIVKNDGRYLYILSGDAKGKLSIVDTVTMKAVSEIDFGKNYNVNDFYLYGDTIVTSGTFCQEAEEEYYYWDFYYNYDTEVQSRVYDVSDRENPSLKRTVTQDGQMVISSRMVNSVLYTVTDYRVYSESLSDVKKNAVPEVDGEKIMCDCIYIYDEDSQQYLVLTAFDTSKEDSKVNTISILGGGDSVYCTKNNLYVSKQNYDYDTGDNVTDIYRFSLDGENITYEAVGSVKGYTNNQYSFDEYNGILRVATTYYSYQKDVDVSSIYALNSDLEVIGKLEDIAFDEQIKSVRFMGDVGYIVTFRNTDPLFTLDLADPTSMSVIGEVKLPGFSAYLHPVGEGLVAGVGYDGTEEDVDFNKIKVSLFDVSDLKNPKEVSNFIIENAYTNVIDDPKAFLYYPEENYIGIPVNHYSQTNGGGDVLSYKLLKIENGEISSHIGFTHGTGYSNYFRGTYIGNMLYTIDGYTVAEHNIDTGEKERVCTVSEKDESYYDGEVILYGGEVTVSPAYDPESGAGGSQVTTTAADDITAQSGSVVSENSESTEQASSTDYGTTKPFLVWE